MKRLLIAALSLVAASGFAADKKRVVVCTVTTGFRHSSIPYAEKTIEKIGNESGAFEVVAFAQQPNVSIPKKPNEPRKPKEPAADADDATKAKYTAELKRYEEAAKRYADEMAKWTTEKEQSAKNAQANWDSQMKESMSKLSPDYLKSNKIDCVIFANTTGDLPLPDKEGFIKWIEDGHAFCAMHSGSDTFHHFPGYINMLQGEFETHGAQVPADLVAADKDHPANAGIGPTWDLKQEEMYIIKNQDPAKVRALWYLKHHPNNPKDVGYFPVSWCRTAGKGRVFYTSLGHREDLWSDDPNLRDRKNSVEISKQYQAHLLGGIKWALGLAEGSAEPNPEATK